jgi:hypothetical protein
VSVEKKKTLRVDLTRSTVQLATQRVDSTSLFLITRIRVESTSVWFNENKNNNEKKQKVKHDLGICRSKVYVYYDVFKVIF